MKVVSCYQETTLKNARMLNMVFHEYLKNSKAKSQLSESIQYMYFNYIK